MADQPSMPQACNGFSRKKLNPTAGIQPRCRKAAVECRRNIARERGMDFVVQVADKLFSGRILEEKIFAVFLLEKQTKHFGDSEFRLFASWLDRVSCWADHDALAHDLLAPMVGADPKRCREVFRWAKSPNRWRRRAACVALIRGEREQKFFAQSRAAIESIAAEEDEDDMVQKGLGWLLRETAKADPKRAVPYLMKIRKKLRASCCGRLAKRCPYATAFSHSRCAMPGAVQFAKPPTTQATKRCTQKNTLCRKPPGCLVV
jgi:3-methyladenine DNA glycosylase AlkD